VIIKLWRERIPKKFWPAVDLVQDLFMQARSGTHATPIRAPAEHGFTNLERPMRPPEPVAGTASLGEKERLAGGRRLTSCESFPRARARGVVAAIDSDAYVASLARVRETVM
jgi:hypothetical protein